MKLTSYIYLIGFIVFLFSCEANKKRTPVVTMPKVAIDSIVLVPVIVDSIIEVIKPPQKSKSAKEWGLKEGKEFARTNYTKLISALKTGKKLRIDAIYYVKKGNSNNDTILKNIDVIGKGKLIIDEHLYTSLAYVGTINYIKWNVAIQGTNDDDSHVLFRQVEYSYIDKIDFNINIENNIALFRARHGDSLNPLKNRFGFGKMNVNVVFKNQSAFIIEGSDTPFKNVTLEAKGTNFSNVPFWFGISNNHTYLQKIKKAMGKIELKNSTVTNDAFYFNKKKGMYYALLLSEADKTIYHDNYVKGMKCKEVTELYDAFLSSNYAEYYNNKSINNLCFNPKKISNSLLKIKATKNYKAWNSSFTITDNFIKKYNVPRNGQWVKFYDMNNLNETMSINNIIVDVPILIGHVVPVTYKNLSIRNTTLKANLASGWLVYPRDNNANVIVENVTYNFKEKDTLSVTYYKFDYTYKPFEIKPSFLKNRGFRKIIIK